MDKLSKVLAQDDTVLFIGSGISLWSGLPTWSGLIEQLASFIDELEIDSNLVRYEAERGDLLQAASYGFDKLTKPQIGEFIRKACNYGTAKPHEIHKKIVSLGPSCYITTNYDNLIEESLRIWQPDSFYKPSVTNLQLTNLADIVGAGSRNFVFKPHGDASDAESIILSHEQYRELLPDGDRHAALDSVKMLLATRPIVYLGFGLRDPDFLHIKDLLANTYKGGARDHYAIVADVTSEEKDYWRKNYGVYLSGYATIKDSNGKRDHTPLLELLNSLQPALVSEQVVESTPTLNSSDIILSLARHAGRLSRVQKSNPEFPVRVHLERDVGKSSRLNHLYKYDHCLVDEFLDIWPDRAVLIGLPGAGKSYSLTHAVARLADKLNSACLEERFDESDVVVPIFADLKLYSGNLRELITQSLPNGLTLDLLSSRFRLKIFLDSFNEMPREFWETAAYETDFKKFIEGLSRASLVIGSRTNDGLAKLEMPCFSLDQIDEEFVIKELDIHKIKVNGRFKNEVLNLLQKPFYFQLIINRKIGLPKEAHPRDFYQSFFKDLSQSFNSRFQINFDLEQVLTLIAYEAIDRGEEAQPLSLILDIISKQLQIGKVKSLEALEVANWLVSKSVIVPYIGSRAAFFHQSATEYLAASELARRYIKDTSLIVQKLALTNWDQTLFLTLSLLTNEEGKLFLDHVIDADFALALQATKYLEHGRDEILSRLLSEIPNRLNGDHSHDWKIQNALERGVTVTDVHEQHLREILKKGDSLAGSAVLLLVELKGPLIKNELMELILANHDDFNFCANGIGPAIQPFITSRDIKKMLALLDSFDKEITEDNCSGLISGFAKAFENISITQLRNAVIPKSSSSELSELRAGFLCELLYSRHTTEALNLAGDLLIRGVKKASTMIYFIANFRRENIISWDSFNEHHIESLLALLDDKESWALKALKCLCEGRPDLAEMLNKKALDFTGIYKSALLYCSNSESSQIVYEELSNLLTTTQADRDQKPIHLIGQMDITWKGHEQLLIQLLKLRDPRLAVEILELDYDELGEISIGPIEWWLEWISDENLDWFIKDRISRLFANQLSEKVKKEFLKELNNPSSQFREINAKYFLNAINEFTTDDFTEETIEFLLNDIASNEIEHIYRGHIISNNATEEFVTKRLIPLLENDNVKLLTNLKKILMALGARHGRRYVAL